MERGLDWLLQLPDPREEGAAEADVNSSSGLRPLRASSSQPRCLLVAANRRSCKCSRGTPPRRRLRGALDVGCHGSHARGEAAR